MRVAHFSDLHLLDLHAVSPLDFASSKVLVGSVNVLLNRARKHRLDCFEALVDDLNAQRYDHVVCTGDLVNLGLPAEYELAARLVSQIRLGPAGVTLVPGNHDYYTRAAITARRFERAFAPFLRGDAGGAVRYPFLRLRGAVAIIGLCSAYASPLGFADGLLGPRQIAAAEALLTQPDVRERFRLVLVHHPPVVHHGLFVRHLRDRGALLRMLARAGAELVVHGHDHRAERAETPGRDGPIPIIGVASGSYADERPDRAAQYHVYHIERGRPARITRRVWDRNTSKFKDIEWQVSTGT
ncbi:MAG TPA: metallophosphoesterase [Polyangia bacterium]|jgi:3',5'-cyclic AMP phosphodiesterase CpdA